MRPDLSSLETTLPFASRSTTPGGKVIGALFFLAITNPYLCYCKPMSQIQILAIGIAFVQESAWLAETSFGRRDANRRRKTSKRNTKQDEDRTREHQHKYEPVRPGSICRAVRIGRIRLRQTAIQDTNATYLPQACECQTEEVIGGCCVHSDKVKGRPQVRNRKIHNIRLG